MLIIRTLLFIFRWRLKDLYWNLNYGKNKMERRFIQRKKISHEWTQCKSLLNFVPSEMKTAQP